MITSFFSRTFIISLANDENLYIVISVGKIIRPFPNLNGAAIEIWK